MNATLAADLARLVPLIGWTLANFLWQGALIAFVLQVALRASRTARARHDWALAALGLMAVAPVATFLWLQANIRIVLAPPGAPGLGADAGVSWEMAAVAAWGVGVTVLVARSIGGLVLVERLRRTAQPLPADWEARCQALRRRMSGSLRAVFAQSGAIATPVVAGWLKPMVLIPAAALMRLPVDQLEALILHELAHVRRLDAFANLLQTVVETALFYHPAVWWVSRRIRIERERCCDDLAVAEIRDPGLYVRALQAMDSLRAPPFGVLAAGGGDLKSRAARVLGLDGAPERPALSRTAAVLILAAAGAAMAEGAAVRAEPTGLAASAPAVAAGQVPGAVPASPPRAPRVVLVRAPKALADATPPAASSDAQLAARIAALGPMPPDSDPAAQAAWRASRYDLDLDADRARLASDTDALGRARAAFDALKTSDPNAPARLKTLNVIDLARRQRDLTRVHTTVVQSAKDAVLRAERVRRAVGETAAPADVTAAQAMAHDSERAVEAIDEAETSAQRSAASDTERLDALIAKTTPGYAHGVAANAPQDPLESLEQRARWESIAFAVVRDAVDAGKRPPADLETERQVLAAAQAAFEEAWITRHPRTSPPSLPPPPVFEPTIEAAPGGRDVFDILRDLGSEGKMPGDDQPAAQAAWRARHYDLLLEQARTAGPGGGPLSIGRQSYLTIRWTDPDDPRRLRTLNNLDNALHKQVLDRLKIQFLVAARDANAIAETARKDAAEGRGTPQEAAAARRRATEAARDYQVVNRAISSAEAAAARASMRFTTQADEGSPATTQLQARLETLDKVTDLARRASLESIAYAQVRAEVRAGRRPAADLDVAREALKQAQEPLFDAESVMMKDMTAQQTTEKVRVATQIEVQETRIKDLESRLPGLTGAERQRVEAQLQSVRTIDAMLHKTSANMSLTRKEFERPALPILPPETDDPDGPVG
ncbi:M56 family metallopeptidase [Phenylobacterium sp.]|jgi:D-alanyl-D-alanine endopeptidase (penicillin-binding protein 7)|uniref:M56 family metallopeptidase n=1 Tax=Phenylobacterium sp. TaxID=1871053 RepID=UPI002F424327